MHMPKNNPAARVTYTLCLCAFVPLCLLRAASAGEVSFTAKPTVTGDGDKTKITFTVSAPTDVEMAVLAADGRVVRHLVAGVLGGPNPPPEPLKAGLAQSIAWDGNDDSGKKAAGGPFKIRVRLGMSPQFDGFLLDNPDSLGPVLTAATGPKGSLYVFHADGTTGCGHWGSNKIKVFSRDGHSQKVVMPFPADLPAERLKPLGVFQDKDGDLVPHIHHMLRFSFYPGTPWRMAGQAPAVDSTGRIYWMVLGPALAALDADGGVPADGVVGPRLLPEVKDLAMANEYRLGAGYPCLAVSGDDKFVYFAGLKTGDGKSYRDLPCVFRVDAAKRGPGEAFVGKPDQAGTEKELLTAPMGLAVAGGKLYVADAAADRIAVFNEADRAYVGEIKVKAPRTIGVDPATGAVYVCSAETHKSPALVKFEGFATGKELYRVTLQQWPAKWDPMGLHHIAVDASAKPVRVWGIKNGWLQTGKIFCAEDAGDKFVLKDDPRDPAPWAEGPRDLSIDRVRGELYVKSHTQSWYRIEEKTGKLLGSVQLQGLTGNPNRGTQLLADAEGKLNSYSWGGTGLQRFDRDGKPANWPGQQTHHLPVTGLMTYQLHNLAFLRPDELFVILPRVWKMKVEEPSNPPTNNNTTCVSVMGPDGKVKRTAVWQCYKGAIVRLDAKGNIYLADMVKPEGRSFPEFFDGKIQPPPAQTGTGDDRYYYSYMYGSIIKFPPEGGAIWYRKDLPENAEGEPPAELLAKPRVKVSAHDGYRTLVPAELQGALWYRFGFAPYSATSASCALTCMCEGGGFDVDAYGRVFFPNTGQFRAEVVDTNNNPIAIFGKYGNQDSGGPAAKVKKPEVPLAWPLTVAVSDTHAYVADTLNRRVVKVRLAAAVEESVEVK
jgi:hypothetical protein